MHVVDEDVVDVVFEDGGFAGGTVMLDADGCPGWVSY